MPITLPRPTQFNYKLPSGEIIKASINPNQAATIDPLEDLYRAGSAFADKKRIPTMADITPQERGGSIPSEVWEETIRQLHSPVAPSTAVTTPNAPQAQFPNLAVGGQPAPLASYAPNQVETLSAQGKAMIAAQNVPQAPTAQFASAGGLSTSATAQQQALEKIRGAFQATNPAQQASLEKVMGAFGGTTSQAGTPPAAPQAPATPSTQTGGGTQTGGTTGGGTDWNQKMYELLLSTIGTGETLESEKKSQTQLDEFAAQQAALAAQQRGIGASRDLGVQALGEQPIAMPFISGQQKAVTDRAAVLTGALGSQIEGIQAQALPLSTRLAREQSERMAKRQASIDVAKTGLEYGFKKESLDLERQKAAKPDYSLAYKEYQDAVRSGYGGTFTQYQNEDANRKIAIAKAGLASTPTVSPYQQERAFRATESVDSLLITAKAHPEIFGRTASMPIPDFMRSDAFRDFESELKTLKASIAFNELTAMREASKTGGALGQVAVRELELLESALGALDMKQSPENFQEQLSKIKGSIERWSGANAQAGAGGGSKTAVPQDLYDAGTKQGYSSKDIEEAVAQKGEAEVRRFMQQGSASAAPVQPVAPAVAPKPKSPLSQMFEGYKNPFQF